MIELGKDSKNKPVRLDIDRLVSTRMLLQTNSGGGKSWAIERFQNDEDCRFFIGNPQTAGYGITLIAASLVIYYANSWKLAERMQSEDRNHRIGQTEAVTYVDLVAPGTVDERIIDALRSKHEIAGEVLGEQWRTWIGKAAA